MYVYIYIYIIHIYTCIYTHTRKHISLYYDCRVTRVGASVGVTCGVVYLHDVLSGLGISAHIYVYIYTYIHIYIYIYMYISDGVSCVGTSAERADVKFCQLCRYVM